MSILSAEPAVRTATGELSATGREGVMLGLAESVFDSPALCNEFYERWTSEPQSYPKVRVFAEQYLARTVNTSVMVALSVLNTDDLLARVECVKNLYSEYGNGDATKAHLVLLEGFLADLLSRMSGQRVTAEQLHPRHPLASTVEFSTGQRELFTSTDQRVVQGALLAQEWLAYSMLVRLYEGVRHYKPCYASEEEFHEACEYFYVHIGEAEKEHKILAVRSAAQICSDDDDLDMVARGFHGFLGLTAGYWAGVAAEMRRV